MAGNLEFTAADRNKTSLHDIWWGFIHNIWGRDDTAAIWGATYWYFFSCITNINFWSKFNWNLFIKIQSTMGRHWFRWCLVPVRRRAISSEPVIWWSNILTNLPQSVSVCWYISQMTFSNALSWMKSFVFWFKFLWSLFLSVKFTISEHWVK